MNGPAHPTRFPASRPSFTLAELLVVVTIIGMLAAMVSGVLVVSRLAARDASSRATIAKLHSILTAKYESYRTRRVPLSDAWPGGGGLSEMANVAYQRFNWRPPDPTRPWWTNPSNEMGFPPSNARDGLGRPLYWAPYWVNCVTLAARRDIMRMEMPERTLDLALPLYLPAAYAPSLNGAYRARYLLPNGNPISPSRHPSAEMLYMTITMACGEDARKQFTTAEISDTDGNGFSEFVDGWGNPIYFLRWAPGFNDSELQWIIDPANMSATMLDATQNDHDPLDTRRLDAAAWRLVPLIYSAGRDGQYGLWQDGVNPDPPYQWFSTPAGASNTFIPISDTNLNRLVLVGQPIGTTHYDNIHNHQSLTEAR